MSDTTTARELIEAGRYLVRHELAWGNAGNLSARTGADSYLISASGTRLGELGPDDLAACRVGAPAEGPRRPSKERPMHEAVYAARPEVGAVLHASPFYSTLVACCDAEVPADLFVETMYYLERVARVPYRHPGSTELGEAVAAVARRANVLLLENHGVLVYDTTVREALMAMHTLEMACRMWVVARGARLPLRGVPPATAEAFLGEAGYRPRREWPG
ncbi:MAG TPA: class II aldolase/adducin family protein [Chloroflexaceae bacterium]|nr:class II aldolase/adducin family protein [Chloroflexaceae bacterium]